LLIKAVTNFLLALGRIEDEFKKIEEERRRQLAERKKHDEQIIMLIRLILSKMYKDCCRKLQDAIPKIAKVVEALLEEVLGQLPGSMEAQNKSREDSQRKLLEKMNCLLTMYVSVFQIPNPFTEMQQ
jgi:hypothetical protein